jgi:alanine dehydrogenase
MPFALKLANYGAVEAVKRDRHLKNGVNTYRGRVTYKAVAEDQGLEHAPIDDLL